MSRETLMTACASTETLARGLDLASMPLEHVLKTKEEPMDDEERAIQEEMKVHGCIFSFGSIYDPSYKSPYIHIYIYPLPKTNIVSSAIPCEAILGDLTNDPIDIDSDLDENFNLEASTLIAFIPQGNLQVYL